MTLDDIITAEQIGWAEGKGACREVLAWLRDEPRAWWETIRDADTARWLMKYAHAELAQHPALFTECARHAQWYALEYAHEELAKHPRLFAWCARSASWAAIQYACAYLVRYPELFADCARNAPGQALKYAPTELAKYPELFAECRGMCGQ